MEKTTTTENLNSNISFSNLQSITLKSDYMKLRQTLKDSFILFVMYEEYNIDKDNKDDYEETKEFVNDIIEKYNKDLNSKFSIILVSSDKAEQSLKSALNPDLTEDYPYYALGHPHIPEIELLKSNDSFFVFKAIEKNLDFYKNHFDTEKTKTLETIKQVVTSFPVIVFIKGTPHEPYCKFSRTFMDIIKKLKIDYRSFDIFQNDKIRGYMKFYHGFRTFPQLFIKGELVGGLDIIKDLDEKGELIKLVPDNCKYESKINEVKDIINKNEDVLFFRSEIKENINEIENKNKNYNANLPKEVEKFVLDFNKKYIDENNKQLELVDINKNLSYFAVLNEVFNVETIPAYFSRGKLTKI